MHIKHGKTLLITLLALVAGAALYRVFMPDPYVWIENRLPLSIPYDFGNATERVQVDFQLLPGDHIPAAYYVGFDIGRTTIFDPVRYLEKHDMPLNVIVERISPGGVTRIDSFGMYQIGCMNGRKPCSSEQRKEVREGVTKTYMLGHTSGAAMVIAAGFWLNDYGQYRVTIEFPNDVPELTELNSRLVVREKQRAK